MHAPRLTAAVTALSALLAVAPALAGGFDLKGPDVTKGETEIAVSSAYLSGFPINADLLRVTGEAGIGHGVTDWWKLGVKFNFEKAVGGDLEIPSVGVETQFQFRKAEGRSPAIALYMSVEAAVIDTATNTFTIGPLWQWALDDKSSFTLNTLFSRTFGRNSVDQTDFTYAWQVKREVREGFGVGLEGYGLLPNIGHTPGVDFQEHRVGPVLYFERSLKRDSGPAKVSMKDSAGNGGGKDDGGPKLNIEAGILFGLTNGTQDRAYKLKGAVTF